MQRIILIGFMGAGKSSLGKKLANKLDIPFIDSDQEIETYFERSIGEIFGEFGESRFREIEKEYIQALDLRENFVLATGGGMPCFGNNMELLNDVGTTFYLKRSAGELTHRLKNSKTKRPLIEGLEELELFHFVEEKLSQRQEFYMKSNIILDREEQKVNELLKITHHLQLQRS